MLETGTGMMKVKSGKGIAVIICFDGQIMWCSIHSFIHLKKVAKKLIQCHPGSIHMTYVSKNGEDRCRKQFEILFLNVMEPEWKRCDSTIGAFQINTIQIVESNSFGPIVLVKNEINDWFISKTRLFSEISSASFKNRIAYSCLPSKFYSPNYLLLCESNPGVLRCLSYVTWMNADSTLHHTVTWFLRSMTEFLLSLNVWNLWIDLTAKKDLSNNISLIACAYLSNHNLMLMSHRNLRLQRLQCYAQ